MPILQLRFFLINLFKFAMVLIRLSAIQSIKIILIINICASLLLSLIISDGFATIADKIWRRVSKIIAISIKEIFRLIGRCRSWGLLFLSTWD